MQIILETKRLTLRTFCEADITPMAAINADPIVMEHFPATQDLAMTQTLVKHFMHHYEQFGYAAYATIQKDTGNMIGFVGLNQPSFTIPHFQPQGLPIVEIGWRLARSAWGQGLATEAAQAVLAHAFQVLHLPEIISFTARSNVKSQRVMQKIGLKNQPKDNFDHPKLDASNPLCPHVLYRLTQSAFIGQQQGDLV